MKNNGNDKRFDVKSNDQQYSPLFCAQRLKVLADPNRFAILKLLLNGAKYVWELNTELDLEQSLLSHHLKILRQEGLVQSQREGKAVRYCLAPGVRTNSGKGINLECCVLSFELTPPIDAPPETHNPSNDG